MEVTIDGEIWTLGDVVGGGGFGSVYEVVGAPDPRVVKLVLKDQGAHRELLFASDVDGLDGAIPVLGLGEAGDYWAIAMPRAEHSLASYIHAVGRPLASAEALPILLDIAQAIVGISGCDIVHRDLKPANVLRHKNKWRLTDFGISRYANAATSVSTRKEFLSPAYGAPEQWLGERATAKTDIYAFGIIAYQLLTGDVPFKGAEFEVREMHLTWPPERLSEAVSTPLRSIVDECLIKAPQARPTPKRLLERLRQQEMAEPLNSGGGSALAVAHQRHIDQVTEQARADARNAMERERRGGLFGAAREQHERLRDRVRNFVVAAAPSVEPSWPLRLGKAYLDISETKVPVDRSTQLPFDVIAASYIVVDQSNIPGGTYIGRSHSLWFCDAHQEGEYAWFETAFMKHPLALAHESTTFNAADLRVPSACAPNDLEAIEALRGGGAHQLAWPFLALQDEAIDEFINRWADWFASAQAGTLQKPSTLPERSPTGSYRMN